MQNQPILSFARADLAAGRFRSARVSVSLIFLIHGILVSSWIARIPAVKEKLGDDGRYMGAQALGWLGRNSKAAKDPKGPRFTTVAEAAD